jgi:orotate phosphoribosyltransferase-like protein
MAEVEISQELIQKAMTNPGVAAQLQVVADRVKARAEALAKQEGVDMKVSTVTGIRPRGRPFVNVVSDNPDQEFGSATHKRYRILGRAGEGG